MINFNTPEGSIQVKSSYYDLTVGEYHLILDNIKDHEFILSVLTGIDRSVINSYDFSQVADVVDFLSEDPNEFYPLEFLTVKGKTISNINIRSKSWAQKIASENLVRVMPPEKPEEEGSMFVADLVELVAIYIQPKFRKKKDFNPDKLEKVKKLIHELPAAEVYPFGIHLQNQLIDIKKLEAKMLKAEHTAEQKQAGINEFDKLGIFNTIDMLAQGDPLKYDDVLKIDYGTIFNKLLLLNISVKFDKRLSKILRDKNKPIGKNT